MKRKANSVEAAKADGRQELAEVVAEEYICPISYNLPSDPVIAEDGQLHGASVKSTASVAVRIQESPVVSMGDRRDRDRDRDRRPVRRSVHGQVRRGHGGGAEVDVAVGVWQDDGIRFVLDGNKWPKQAPKAE